MIEERRHTELAVQPDVYEIKVKGRLDGDYWAQWFEGMTVTVRNGETVIIGPVADQAALYGMLSRLRDLALPLLSVSVLSEKGTPFRLGKRWLFRINWLLLLFYLLVVGGLSSLTVFLTSVLDTALALTLLFGALGGIAYAFSLWDGGWGWRAITALTWPGALISLIIYLTVMDWLHPALAIAILLFLLAGGLMYFLARRQNRAVRAPAAQVRWEKLGSFPERTEPNPADRDR